MINNLIIQLQKKLRGQLPGIDAHQIMSPNKRFTGKLFPDKNTARESSVLVLLYTKNNQLYIPFIERPLYNGAHSGQISLPGGKVEPRDKSILETALRETYEEIGVSSDRMEILGQLTTTYIPNSNFNVNPFVAYLPFCPDFFPDNYEVAQIIEAPLNQLLSPNNVDTFIKEINGHTIKAPYFNIQGHQIWGATAMIISELKEIINELNIIPSDSYNAHNDQVSL